MRKVVANLFYSIDGVVESPNHWSGFDEDMGEKINSVIGRQDDVLLGRTTYEEWAGYWPTSTDEPFASFINNVRKHVVSTSLKEVEWKNARLLAADVAGEVGRLKGNSGRDIGTHGSIRLVQSLLRLGLADELILYIMPTVAGRGRHLFEQGIAPRPLALTDSRVTRTGIAILTYALAKL
jgi:dihydrofolate reductase